MMIDFSRFAIDNDDAAARAALYSKIDPFRSVPSALLSSAEIYDYARVTGMLFRFYPDALKSASYEAHIGGSVIWWDEHGCRKQKEVGRGDPCILLPNSITFVEVEPVFRLPNYIAVRFNLRITHVHRGLLLGTGPLVDPGFGGKLLIPLHNLTSSEYSIDTTEALIWIEFTKTTYGFVPFVPGVGGPTSPIWEPMASQDRHFVEFEARKKFKTPDYYLRKANAGNPIRSSIPDALEQGRSDAAASAASAAGAAATATRIRNVLFGIGFVTIAALAVALYAIYYQVAGLVQNSIGLSTSVEQGLAPLASDSRVAAENLTAAQTQLGILGQQVVQLKQEIEALKQRVPPPRTDQKSQHRRR
jgi:deoxycytidine triphosphate deaminase